MKEKDEIVADLDELVHDMKGNEASIIINDGIEAQIAYLEDNGVDCERFKKEKKYNHAYTIAFSINSDREPEDVTEEELREGVKLKMEELLQTEGSLESMCGLPFDTFEN